MRPNLKKNWPMPKTILRAAEWDGLIVNKNQFDLASEKSNKAVPTPTPKQMTNRKWYERDKLKRFTAIVASSIKRPKALE